MLCERVQQYGLGYFVGWGGARHCRAHVRCDDCKGKYGKYDNTYELTGYGPGALRGEPFDPRRAVNPRVPVRPPSGGSSCSFEDCIARTFLFYLGAAVNGRSALPNYGPINANSNAFVYGLVRSCGGQMSYPGTWASGYAFFGQMPD